MFTYSPEDFELEINGERISGFTDGVFFEVSRGRINDGIKFRLRINSPVLPKIEALVGEHVSGVGRVIFFVQGERKVVEYPFCGILEEKVFIGVNLPIFEFTVK